MTLKLTAKEILGIAADIERQAAGFFRKTAQTARGEERRRMFLQLAQMEDEHEMVFAALRDQITEEDSPHAAGQQMGTAMLSRSVVDNVHGDLQAKFDGSGGEGAVAEHMIDFEKDTIVFFTEIMNMLTDPADRRKVEAIIKEELGHIISLRSGLLAGPK